MPTLPVEGLVGYYQSSPGIYCGIKTRISFRITFLQRKDPQIHPKVVWLDLTYPSVPCFGGIFWLNRCGKALDSAQVRLKWWEELNLARR